MTAKDPRFLLAAILLLGYYALLFMIGMRGQPINNPDIFKDGMIVLGPPVGAVFATLFRTDALDEKRAQNTSDAFAAIKAQADSSPTTPPAAVLSPGQTATVVAAPSQEN